MSEIPSHNPQVNSRRNVLALAFYLPQFYPTAENNAWWEPGFTEWTNVTRAMPRFRNHAQPHLPRDLGFYDLRLRQAREAQARLGMQFGIDGFCYYHYWFEGKRILERPVEEMLASSEYGLPICLCWANESWTKVWSGESENILLRQAYSPEDDERHASYLAKVFANSRYIRIDGRPLFLVYRARRHPDLARFRRALERECSALGILRPFLIRVESNGEEGDPADLSCDAAVEFPPHGDFLGLRLRSRWPWRWIRRLGMTSRAFGLNRIYRYSDILKKIEDRPPVAYVRIPCVCPGWDNSARTSSNALILIGSTPRLYRDWLAAAVERAPTIGDKRVVFINAWNEWAEGNHLEPCQRWQTRYLEMTREILRA